MTFGDITSVVIISATKFLFAPSAAILYHQFTYWETILVVVSGGVFGVTFFYFFGTWIMKMIAKQVKKSDEKKRAAGKIVVRKIFTPFRRKVIRIKNRFGLVGIAFVTPCIISIPIGTIIAARFFNNPWKILGTIYFFVIFWAFVLTTFNDVVVRLIAYIS